jgi:hypothetical protein
MKKFAVLSCAFVLLFGLATAASATNINYSFATNGNEFISPYAGVITEDFTGDTINSLPGGSWTWSGNGVVLNGDVPNKASAPAFSPSIKDASNYVSIPEQDAFSTAGNTALVVNLGGLYNYFGLWWGSVDNYNTLSFYNGATLVASFTGSQAINPSAANGNQTAPGTNLYVNFLDLPLYNSFTMSSWQDPANGISYAFEADNISIGVVPEPTTMLLLGLGLIGMAGVRRFRK